MRRIVMWSATFAGLLGVIVATGFVRGQESKKTQAAPAAEKHQGHDEVHVESVGIAKPQLGFLTHGSLDGVPVLYAPINNRAIFEGDIDLGSVEEMELATLAEVQRRAAGIDPDTLEVSDDVRGAINVLKARSDDAPKPKVNNNAAFGHLVDLAERVSTMESVDDATKKALETLGNQLPKSASDDDEPATQGVVRVGAQFRWPRGRVPFEIAPGFPSPERITGAIAEWHAKTRIRLIPRLPSQVNYVRFVVGNGCSSQVGMVGGRQNITLAAGCSRGSVIHEIAHAVGLWHEQSREDRNGKVRIFLQNVQPGTEHNFLQHIVDGDDVGVYDFGSIMHYPRKAFSKNGLDTIVPLGGQTIGQRNALSAGDVAAVRSIYPNLLLADGSEEEIETETADSTSGKK